ncbi:MAG: FkbM family methyltransferase [Crocinitomicaceae bacterium]|nr:FkbM family methyltransferase [Crocinitomicaceae bacterium]
MKNFIKYILQKVLGFRRYLFVFARYKIRTLKKDNKENDFFYFLSLLKDGNGSVLDIGANLGIMTVHLAESLPKSTIHAFEPMPDNRVTFKRIVSKYGLDNVTFHEIALGDEQGSVNMILPTKDGAKLQGLSHVKHDSITEWNQGEECKVPIDRLDNVIKEIPIQGIKMDVENFEFFVLKGGLKMIKRDQPIIYTELWDNENRTNCFDLLSSIGYTTYAVIGSSLIPYDPTKHQTQNFIFTAN